MGKQSSRICYKGKDHKDIYYQKNYHRAMYKGDELVWMKIGGEYYIPFISSEIGWKICIYYPESNSVEVTENVYHYAGNTSRGIYEDGYYRFNGTFLFTVDMRCLSRDGKKFVTYDEQETEAINGFIGGALGFQKLYFLNNDGKLENSIETSIETYQESTIRVVDYFKKECFFSRWQTKLVRVNKNGYEYPEKNLGNEILYYVYIKGKHIFLTVSKYSWLILYETEDFDLWNQTETAIRVEWFKGAVLGGSAKKSLSVVYADEKYLLYTLYNDKISLYETNDFLNFSYVELPDYTIIRGTKENGVVYLFSDSNKATVETIKNISESEGVSFSFVLKHIVYFKPPNVGISQTLLYNNGIKQPVQSLFFNGDTVGGNETIELSIFIYIDNLYLRESENNFCIDFMKDLKEV